MNRLAPNIAAALVTAGSVIATALVSVPIILDHVGLAGYGVWTLALTLLLYVTIAEAGVGPAVQRFVAVAAGARRTDAVARLLWSSLALYLAAGVLAALLCVLLAPALVDLLGPAPSMRADATETFRLIGPVVAVALLAAALGNVQQGLEQFQAFAASAIAGSVVFLVLVIVLLDAGLGLPGLAYAAAGQQAAITLVRVVSLRGVLAAGPRLLDRDERGDVFAFALRLQMTVLSMLVNTQTDKLVVGAVATPSTLGLLGIGSQVAEAGRLVGGAGLSPLISRLSSTRGSEAAPGALEAMFARMHHLWLVTVTGGTIVGAAALYPLIAAWLGGGHGRAAVYGGFLVVAYGLNLLTGSGVAYLRAVGRPSLEARYGSILIASNLALTVACGLAFGALGVVAATMLAYAVGTSWFFHHLPRAAPEISHLALLPPAGAAARGLAAGAVALGWGLAMIALLPAGVALAPVALGTALAFAGYAAWETGVRPTPRNLRSLIDA